MIFDHFYSVRLGDNTHSFIQTISIAPLQVQYYPEALPTQHGYCTGISRRSATGNCELRTCLRSLCGGYSASRTHDPSDERRRLYQLSIGRVPHTYKECDDN